MHSGHYTRLRLNCLFPYVLEFDPKVPGLSNSKGFVNWFKEQCIQLSNGGPVLLTANAKYLTDELCRDIKVFHATDDKFKFTASHDTCVVEPCIFKTQQNIQCTVFCPWYKKWCSHLMDKKPKDKLIATSVVQEKEMQQRSIYTRL